MSFDYNDGEPLNVYQWVNLHREDWAKWPAQPTLRQRRFITHQRSRPKPDAVQKRRAANKRARKSRKANRS